MHFGRTLGKTKATKKQTNHSISNHGNQLLGNLFVVNIKLVTFDPVQILLCGVIGKDITSKKQSRLISVNVAYIKCSQYFFVVA